MNLEYPAKGDSLLDIDDYTEKPQENKNNEEPQKTKTYCLGFLTLEFYQPYFDIDQDDVAKRLISSLFPSRNFYKSIQNKPDLYGPFWIFSTLIFLIAASGNFSMYIHGYVFFIKNQQEYQFDFVPVAASLIYGIGLFYPIVLCFVMRFLGSNIKYVELICLYGYSMVIFIPVTLLCVIPNTMLQWLLLFYALGNTLSFLYLNLNEYAKDYSDQNRYFINGITFGCQLVIIAMYKFYFFAQIFVM